MRLIIVGSLLIGALLSGCLYPRATRFEFGMSSGPIVEDSYYMELGNYYGYPEREVIVLRERNVPDEEIPVVLFIASRAHVSSGAVLELRAGGSSWMDIAFHFGLGPEVFYVPVEGNVGPPYGRAYGYYRQHGGWKTYRMGDEEVVNFVNLRFVSDRYSAPPAKVIQMRSKGRGFRDISEGFRKDKEEHRGRGEDRQ